MANEIVMRPSKKRALAGLLAAAAIFLCLAYFWKRYEPQWSPLVLLAGLIPFLFPLWSYVESLRTKVTVAGGVLRFETGFISTETRSMDLGKLLDVRVERSLWQRLWNTGNVIFVTAAEDGRIEMPDVDRPQSCADAVLEASRRAESR
jgi:uncharacterized membrane protein YdbT with pleckstrin-like domain